MKVEIKDSDLNILCELDDVRVISDGNCTHKPIYLIDPVTIHPGQTYHAAVTVRGPNSYYGAGGLNNVILKNICLELTDSSQDNNGSRIDVGQIPQLIIQPIG